MAVDVWQATTSIHWVCQSELGVLVMLICTLHEASMNRRKCLLCVIHHITSYGQAANILWNKTVKVFFKIHNENILFGIMNKNIEETFLKPKELCETWVFLFQH